MSEINSKASLKSVAGALLFTIFFGPIGLFYTSLIGGIVMTLLLLISLGAASSLQSLAPLATIWFFSIVWAMVEVRLYNKKHM